MKKFNLKKGLKINKRDLTIKSLKFLILLVIGYCFAAHNIKTKNYAMIDSIGEEDVTLSILVDGVKQDSFPPRISWQVFDGVNCDNGSTATYDRKKRKLLLNTTGPDACTVSFVTSPSYASLSIENLLYDWEEGNTAGNPAMMAMDDPDLDVRYI